MSANRTEAPAPVCSVCIANFNGKTIIEDCLNSVYSQGFNYPIEIIVHDDASTDGSPELIRERYPDVKLIASEENVGFCVSNNRMVDVARGQYILLLNNDATLFPDALQTLFEEACARPPTILGLPQYDMQTGDLVDIGSLSDPFLNPIPNLDPSRGDVAMVSGACLWIPKALWTQLGGFPTFFHTVAEDMYLACIARLRGYSVLAIARSGFKHHFGKTLGGGAVRNRRLATTRRRRALSERNKSYAIVLLHPAPLLQLLFPLHVASLLIEGAFLALLKRDFHLFTSIYWACLTSLWRERQQLAALRKAIQSTRKLNLVGWLSVFCPWPHKLWLLVKHGLPSIR